MTDRELLMEVETALKEAYSIDAVLNQDKGKLINNSHNGFTPIRCLLTKAQYNAGARHSRPFSGKVENKMTYEECCRCGNRTHRAGIGEDSIYFGDFGPYCEDCRDSIGEIFSDEITALRERVKVLEEVKAIYSEFITSNDLSAVDKHCDRVQFKHAWGALWNKRRCAAALEIKTLHPVFLFYT